MASALAIACDEQSEPSAPRYRFPRDERNSAERLDALTALEAAACAADVSGSDDQNPSPVDTASAALREPLPG
jgi:hypothetical protein